MKGILVDKDGELIIEAGGIKIGDNRTQVAEHLLIACTGEYKEEPLLGGNTKLMLGGSADPFWLGNVKKQLKEVKAPAENLQIIGDNIILKLID